MPIVKFCVSQEGHTTLHFLNWSLIIHNSKGSQLNTQLGAQHLCRPHCSNSLALTRTPSSPTSMYLNHFIPLILFTTSLDVLPYGMRVSASFLGAHDTILSHSVIFCCSSFMCGSSWMPEDLAVSALTPRAFLWSISNNTLECLSLAYPYRRTKKRTYSVLHKMAHTHEHEAQPCKPQPTNRHVEHSTLPPTPAPSGDPYYIACPTCIVSSPIDKMSTQYLKPTR